MSHPMRPHPMTATVTFTSGKVRGCGAAVIAAAIPARRSSSGSCCNVWLPRKRIRRCSGLIARPSHERGCCFCCEECIGDMVCTC